MGGTVLYEALVAPAGGGKDQGDMPKTFPQHILSGIAGSQEP